MGANFVRLTRIMRSAGIALSEMLFYFFRCLAMSRAATR